MQASSKHTNAPHKNICTKTTIEVTENAASKLSSHFIRWAQSLSTIQQHDTETKQMQNKHKSITQNVLNY